MSNGRLAIWKPGLVELRIAPAASAGTHAQALTVHRIIALDPGRDWKPIGLGASRWEALIQESAGTEGALFYVRRRHHMGTVVALSPLASAVWPPGRGLLVYEVPSLSEITSAPAAPERPALVAFVSRHGECPRLPAREVRRSRLPNPDNMLVDQDFWMFLAHEYSPEHPLQCIATVHLQVREHRAVTATRGLRLVLLGDPWLSFDNQRAIGGTLAIPLVSAIRQAHGGFLIESAVGPAFGIDSNHEGRLAARSWISLVWGSRVLPRLFAVGIGVEVTNARDILTSPFIAVNLGTLYDAVGGR